MLNPIRGTRGMAVAPHALAAQSALAVLREGGNAIEAMIAAAASIAIAYPHMNSIGGDAFWLIHVPGQAPRAIDACGAAATAASIAWYAERDIAKSIPFRGGRAANTVAGTVSGWNAAHEFSKRELGGKLPLAHLFADAIHSAEHGIAVTRSQSITTAARLAGLKGVHGFDDAYLVDGKPPEAGSLFLQPRLGATLRHLAETGLDDFYRGALAESLANDLAAAGSPLALSDLQRHQAQWCAPLKMEHSLGRLYNMPPPTQGLVSLLILGILDALDLRGVDPSGADYVHLCVEATKQAFAIRDRCITDPAYITVDAQGLLEPARVRALAENVDRVRAAPWGAGKGPADTVWMGVIDGAGRAVTFIQSTYHEYGSGVVLKDSGIVWQNRGCSFSLDPNALNALLPLRKPFHTLNPALALFGDGRSMVYGNMGGDGQPQSQSAVFTRYASFGMNPQEAISAPRWLLGRTWGQTSDTLKLESRFPPAVVEQLRRYGHEVEILQDWDETMGHAGAIVRHANGVLEGGADPRSDGAVAAY